MALLAGEPDALKADKEECRRQKVGFAKHTHQHHPPATHQHHLHPVLSVITQSTAPPCSILYSQEKCADKYVYLDERGLLLKVKIQQFLHNNLTLHF